MGLSKKGALIVTGGSGDIGAAIAVRASLDGFAVCVTYSSNRERAEAVITEIRQHGGSGLAVQADVRSEVDVKRIFDSATRELGTLTALVNNAGVIGGRARVENVTLLTLREVFEVNVFGAFLCAAEAVRRMSYTHGGAGGTIVNISSRASRLGNPGEWVHYAASKGSIDTFTVGLAREVAEEGIRVNAVNPGLIDTKIHGKSGAPDRILRLQGTVPMGRPGTVVEVASVVSFLLSDDSSYVTGTCIDVSGGR